MRATLRAARTRTCLECGMLAVILALSACAAAQSGDAGASVGPGSAPTAAAGGTTLGHVFIIVLENEEASAIYGNQQAPYLNDLASRYAVAERYYAVSHPSLPNYLALTAGTPNPLDGTDCSPAPGCHIPGEHTNLADEIETSGRTWAAYMESMPAPCTLTDSGEYAVRHNPFVYFDDMRTGAHDRCATHDVPYDPTRFTALLTANTAVPDLIWITPNLCDDGHDACTGDPVAQTDTWLARTVPVILGSLAYQRGGALFITWDEGTSAQGCCGQGVGGGQVATLVISPLARQHGYRSTVPYNHYSLLRTIEDGWRLGELGNTNPAVQSATRPMTDFFATP